MHRARSRIQTGQMDTSERKRRAHERSSKISFKLLPLAVLSIPLYGLVFYILTRVQPAAIKNLILPNTYLPLLATVFLATTFLSSFLLQRIVLGLLFSTMITLFLFLKLQSVILTPGLVLIVLLSFGIIALILSVLSGKKHANIS